jgi:hypothetical protein
MVSRRSLVAPNAGVVDIGFSRTMKPRLAAKSAAKRRPPDKCPESVSLPL